MHRVQKLLKNNRHYNRLQRGIWGSGVLQVEYAPVAQLVRAQ